MVGRLSLWYPGTHTCTLVCAWVYMSAGKQNTAQGVTPSTEGRDGWPRDLSPLSLSTRQSHSEQGSGPNVNSLGREPKAKALLVRKFLGTPEQGHH